MSENMKCSVSYDPLMAKSSVFFFALRFCFVNSLIRDLRQTLYALDTLSHTRAFTNKARWTTLVVAIITSSPSAPTDNA